MKKYGKSEEDVHVEKMIQCREIVKEIINFGVSENQKLQIIYLLSLELESRDKMVGITELVKSQKTGLKEEKKILTVD
jgi:hypothetical protein|tara:strand:- start:250 stop:483 length:234 start_codon:yes stop_codon:yes gene_type:complete